METRRYGISGAELAEKLESQPRTIYRDLEALYDAGFPLFPDKDGKHSVWKMVDSFRKDFRIPFTVTELMALYMSRYLLRIFEGMIFQESIETLFEKVKAALLPGHSPKIQVSPSESCGLNVSLLFL